MQQQEAKRRRQEELQRHKQEEQLRKIQEREQKRHQTALIKEQVIFGLNIYIIVVLSIEAAATIRKVFFLQFIGQTI
jgi:uncharacterized membrane protein